MTGLLGRKFVLLGLIAYYQYSYGMEDNRYDVFQMSQQMRALYDFYKLSNLDTRLRFLACRQLELALSGLFPQAEVVPFGSSVNTFGANTTDLDMIVNFASVRNFFIFQS